MTPNSNNKPNAYQEMEVHQLENKLAQEDDLQDQSETEAEALLKQRIEQTWGNFLGLRRSAWIEILGFLLIVLLVDYLWFDGTRFRDFHPHPFWVIVLVASVQYGSTAGIITTVLASFLLLAGNIPQMHFTHDFHHYVLDKLIQPLMWLAAAVVLGELSSRNIRERKDMGTQLAEALHRIKLLTRSVEQIQGIRERLEVRVAGQLRTVSKTWKAAQAIEQLEPEQVMSGVKEMVSTLLEPEQFSLFLLKNDQLQIAMCSGWKDQDPHRQTFNENSPLFQTIAGDNRVISIAHAEDEAILDGQGIIAGPIINPETGALIGMLKIEDLGFAQMSVSTVENFSFICQWVGSVYGNAVKHQQSKAREFFNNEDNLYSEAFFNRHRRFLADLATRIGFDMTMISIQLRNYNELPNQARSQFSVFLGQAVEEILRDTDLAFNQQSDQWEFAIILPGTPVVGAEIVRSRLEEALARKVVHIETEFDYSLEIIVLHKDEPKLLENQSNEISTEDAFAQSTAYYRTQRRFLTALSRRQDFPLSQLRITCARFRLLPEKIRHKFGQCLNDALVEDLRTTDMTLNFQVSTGEFVVLLPGTSVEQVSLIESKLQNRIRNCTGAQDDSPVNCHFEVTNLHQ